MERRAWSKEHGAGRMAKSMEHGGWSKPPSCACAPVSVHLRAHLLPPCHGLQVDPCRDLPVAAGERAREGDLGGRREGETERGERGGEESEGREMTGGRGREI